MFWARVDNRLIHGQVIETWLPHTNADAVIVANDKLSADLLRQEIMGLAIPSGIDRIFVEVEAVHELMLDRYGKEQDPNVIILFASCEDARRAHQHGLEFKSLNLGNMHYREGKEQVCAHVALDDVDKDCLGYFGGRGVELDFRCVPNEPVQVTKTW